MNTDWPVPWEPVEGALDGPLERASYAFVRAFMALFGKLPPTGVRWTLSGLARLACRIDPKRSRAAGEFIDQALGPGLSEREKSERVRAAYRHFFRVVYETEVIHDRIPLDRVDDHFELDLCPEADALRGADTGVVLVGPHVGNWEASMAILPRIGFSPTYAVARPPKNRPMSVAAQRQREHFGGRILHRNGAMKSIPTIVRQGGTIGLLLDQRGRGRCVTVPYFGRPALSDRSIGVLLRRIAVPVVFAACYMTDRPFHYRLVATRVVPPEDLAGLSPEDIGTAMNRGMEELVLEAPEQYFWLHDRYRGAPRELPPDWSVDPAALRPFESPPAGRARSRPAGANRSGHEADAALRGDSSYRV